MLNKIIAPMTIPTKFPEIVITHQAYRKICAYADLCNSEISALGSVKVEGDKIIIEDLYLFEQVVSGTSTDISQKDVSNFLCELIKSGKDPSKLKFWWHSHVNMEVYWSGTDVGTINTFTSDWMISMVWNKRGESKLRLDMFSPFRVYLDNLPYTVEYDTSLNALIQKEIAVKVKQCFFPSLVAYPRNRDNRESEVVAYDERTPTGTVTVEQAIANKRTPEVGKEFGEKFLPKDGYVKTPANIPATQTNIPAPLPPNTEVKPAKAGSAITIPDQTMPVQPKNYHLKEKDPFKRGFFQSIYASRIYRFIFGERWT